MTGMPKDTVIDSNINPGIGSCLTPFGVWTLYHYATMGSLFRCGVYNDDCLTIDCWYGETVVVQV